MNLRSLQKISHQWILKCLSFLAFLSLSCKNHIAHAGNHIDEFDHLLSDFTFSRARIQHLKSLQKARFFPQGNASKNDSIEEKIISCISEKISSDEDFEFCSATAHKLATSDNLNEKRTRVILVSENLFRDTSIGHWESWLRLSASMASVKEVDSAIRIFQVAHQKASRVRDFEAWIRPRLEYFSIALAFQKSGDEQNFVQSLSALEKPSDVDPFQDILNLRFKMMVGKSVIKGAGKFEIEGRQEKIKELSYLIWQIQQDRDELTALRQLVLSKQLSLDLLSRLDVMANVYAENDREWSAISKTIARVGASVSLLTRSKGLQLLMERWTAVKHKTEQSTKFEEDDFIAKSTYVAFELAGELQKLIIRVKSRIKNAESIAILSELSQRMDLISSPSSIVFNNSLFERDLVITRNLRERLQSIQKRIYRANALLSTVYYFHDLDANLLQDIRSFRGEIRSLEDIRSQLLIDYFGEHSNIDPYSQMKYRSLMRNIAQIRKTILDFRKIIIVDLKTNTSSDDYFRFFNEVDGFVSALEKDAQLMMKSRDRRVKVLLKGIGPIQEEISKFDSLMFEFIKDNSADLTPMILSLVLRMNNRIDEKIRGYEVAIELENGAIIDSIRSKKDSMLSTKEKLEDLRRIRSESLEWRIAQ